MPREARPCTHTHTHTHTHTRARAQAYGDGRFPAGCTSRDFVRVAASERQLSSDGWQPEETLL
jgi:hypothetical protein